MAIFFLRGPSLTSLPPQMFLLKPDFYCAPLTSLPPSNPSRPNNPNYLVIAIINNNLSSTQIISVRSPGLLWPNLYLPASVPPTPSFYSTERQVAPTQALRISWKPPAEFSQGGMLCAVGTQRGCCAGRGHSTSPPFSFLEERKGERSLSTAKPPRTQEWWRGGAFTSLISAPWRQQPAA